MKKCVLIGGGLALLLTLVFGGSYVRYAVNQVKEAAANAEPLQMKIGRLQEDVERINPAIRNLEHKIAHAEVEAADLKKSIGERENRLAKSEGNILRLKEDLESENSYFTYVSETYTRDQVRRDLERRFESHKTMEDTLANKKEQLHQKEAALKAAHEGLSKMKSAKQKLLVQIENFKARMEKLSAKQAVTSFVVDDSPVADLEARARDIDIRLKTEEKMVDADKHFDGIKLEEPASKKDLLGEIANHFSNGPKSEAVAGK